MRFAVPSVHQPDPRRRAARWATAVVAVAGLILSATHGAAFADPDTVPSDADIAAAKKQAAAAGRDVAAVQADLIRANLTLDGAATAAAQAAENYNGARWRAQQARVEASDAQTAADTARKDVERQRALYASTVVRSYEEGTQVQGLSTMLEAEGIESLIDRTVTMENTSQALSDQHDSFIAASTIADVAVASSTQALDRARQAEQDADAAWTAAASAEANAEGQARTIAATRSTLIAEMARLQGISVELAQQRQAALEEAAAAAAAAAAQAAAEAAAQAEAEAAAAAAAAAATPTPTPTATPTVTPTTTPTTTPTHRPTPTTKPSPSTPTTTATATPTPTPTPTPPPVPAPVPAPAGTTAAVIAFAKAQIGKPYRYGSGGPDSWDCSGLTSAAWAKGGKSLPHYSVAQYTQSTRITSSQLVPGDLVFWGSSSSSSSIYHVALYVGGGQIIHAPRTGRNVSQESMYGWTAPNFFARP